MDWLKLPEAEILVRLSVAVPGFDSVMLCAALVVFVFWLAKVRFAGEILALGVPVVVVVVVPVELLPPPQAASPIENTNAAEAKPILQRLGFPLTIRRNTPKSSAPAKAIGARVAGRLGRTK